MARVSAALALAHLLAAASGAAEEAASQRQVEPLAGVCLLQRAGLALGKKPGKPSVKFASQPAPESAEDYLAAVGAAYKRMDDLLDRHEAISSRLALPQISARYNGPAVKEVHSSIGKAITELRLGSESLMSVAAGDGGREARSAALLELDRHAQELQSGLDHLERMTAEAM